MATRNTTIEGPIPPRKLRSKDQRTREEKDRKKKKTKKKMMMKKKDQKGSSSEQKTSFTGSAVTRLQQFIVSTKNPKQLLRRHSTGTIETVDSLPIVKGPPKISRLSRALSFMHFECPNDVLGHVLCYTGPQTNRALAKASPYFSDFLKLDEVWRVFSEEYGKVRCNLPCHNEKTCSNSHTSHRQQWNADKDEKPLCWKDYYHQHPCVPVDFDTVDGALKAATGKDQARSVCVLLRPGVYEVDTTLNIHMSHSMAQVRMETIQNFCSSQSSPSDRAVLVSNFGKHQARNCPLISVTQGELHVKNVTLRHASPGVDIWNGNAALQIQPSPSHCSTHPPTPVLPPVRVTLTGADVSSETGRGIVLRGDAQLHIEDSLIHNCAGTGVYIGHQGGDVDGERSNDRGTCRAKILHSDICRNGLGNARGGIPRGHSGLYIEEGRVDTSYCSISRNSSSGISVISAFDASLHMHSCYVVDNGATPLELANFERHRLERNTISVVGLPPIFSSVLSALGNMHSEGEDYDDETNSS